MFNIHGDIIALPDLHFKVKNFIPSGMTIATKNSFSPLLLGPNNDGIGLVKFSPEKNLKRQDIDEIFSKIIILNTLFHTIFIRSITLC